MYDALPLPREARGATNYASPWQQTHPERPESEAVLMHDLLKILHMALLAAPPPLQRDNLHNSKPTAWAMVAKGRCRWALCANGAVITAGMDPARTNKRIITATCCNTKAFCVRHASY